MKSYAEFKLEWLGKGCNPNNADPYGFQCVMVFLQYNVEVMGGTYIAGDASSFWNNYPKELYDEIVNNPKDANQMPVQGDVILFTINHIGICDSADVNQVTCLEQNWSQAGTPQDGKGVVELRSHNYILIKGWLHPKQPLPVQSTVTQDQQNILNFLASINANEGKVREAFGALQDVPNQVQLNTQLTQEVIGLNVKLIASQQSVADKQSLLDTANAQIASEIAQIATLTTDRDTYKAKYMQLLNAQPTWSDIVTMIINKLTVNKSNA